MILHKSLQKTTVYLEFLKSFGEADKLIYFFQFPYILFDILIIFIEILYIF